MTRTVLIGLDGATFTLLDQFMNTGVMPFLKSFTEQGTRANLLSTVCPVTPPAWTTIATGRTPGAHGIYDFILVDDSVTDRIAFRLATGRDVCAEPVWSIAGRQGAISASLNFPATIQSPPFRGFLVPGFVTSRVLRSCVQPREWWSEIKALPDFRPKDVSWDLDEGRIPLGGSLDVESYREWIDYLIRKEQGWCALAQNALEAKNCELVCMVFEGVDRLQHQAWALLDPATRPENPTADEAAVIECCLKYFRQLDGLIKKLVDVAGEDARVLITSDHGFGPTHEVFYANVWLERNGYLTWKPNAERDSEGRLTAHNMREHFESIDWERTVAYARTTSANGIYLRVAQNPGDPGIAPEDYQKVRDRIQLGLLSFRDPRTNSPVVTNVITRDDGFPGPECHHAPDLTLFLRDQGFLSIMPADEIVKPRPEIKGTHRPEGVLIACGPGIRQGARIDDQSVVGIAPTLLYSVGLPIPEDFESPILRDLFETEFLRSEPVLIGPATEAWGHQKYAEQSDEGAPTVSDENVVLERLKALGYVE